MSDERDPAFDALDAPGLSGAVRLAQAALASPAPPAGAEAESRRQVEALMQEAALSPRVLREAARPSPARPWWGRLRLWKR
jgi:hypothetical protein